MTPEQRRRAVEVMADASFQFYYRNAPLDPGIPMQAYGPQLESVLTALLTVADVTWKEVENG